MTLRILTLSDIHLEFGNWEQQKSFIGSLDPDDVDVVVLAGDICSFKQIIESLSLICKRFENSEVIWVHGNHEYYMSDRQTVIALATEACRQNKNLHWLNNKTVMIKGQRFVGTTLWFPWNELNPKIERFMNDFRIISGFSKWVYEENLSAMNFIEGSVDEGDVVVTHYLPSAKSVAPRFERSDLNNFFLCDMESFIRRRGPKVWIHGHTHDSMDYVIPHNGNTNASTRVLCNPRGYHPHDLNPNFRNDLVIEL